MKKCLLPLVLIFLCSTGFSQPDAVRQNQFNVKKNVALQGYDVITYFDNKPEEGSEKNAFQYKGITYYFKSAGNLSKFKMSPEKYEPLYGGWCAYAMGATGEKVKVDPETFKIMDGRLLLFYNFWGNNTLEDWNANEKKLKESADKNWRKNLQ